MSPLRLISVHVEEPQTAAFVWVLTEQTQGEWRRLSASAHPAATYQAAMAQGLRALEQLIDDIDAGPRMPAVSKPKNAFFGFGPAR